MKKQNFKHFVGIDVSKDTFDIAILSNENTSKALSFVFENSQKGTKEFLRCMGDQKLDLEEIFFCMEHTGIYGKLIIARLLEYKAALCVEMSLKIMRATAINRGKNDKLDAIRIAKYALKNHTELLLYEPSKEVLKKVRLLLSLRDKLILFNNEICKQPKEVEHFEPDLLKTTIKTVNKITRFISKQIESVEKELQDLIISDEELNQNITLATSVPGIGKITALYMACFTNMFTKYNTSKQLACYCGVVPFEYSSGSSVMKRPRVHHMANKILKKHLHMGAMSAIRFNDELKEYYLRKVMEGKNKMLVLNNVRNKMIQRLCAVLTRQKPYAKNYSEICLV